MAEIAETLVPQGTQIYTVSQLNGTAREMLEDGLPSVWVAGEISNLARPGSGHMYFSLKDDQAQVRCAMFRNANRALKFPPADGLHVIARGRVTIYEPRGSYQVIVEQMEPAGEGLLRQAFEALKKKLAEEGLFDAVHKQPLPRVPRRVGVVTSPTGAAVRDILHVLRRRFPAVPVVIYPVQVQGERAKYDIVKALDVAADRNECDVLIVGRGGGSLEDLWAFNEEIVARAIFNCPLPIVSAVGHEIDFTIADLVADLRAPTPSAAAELVVPDGQTWLHAVTGLQKRVAAAAGRLIGRKQERLLQLSARLQRREPRYILRQHEQRLDDLLQRMQLAAANRLGMDRLRLQNLLDRLRAAAPIQTIRLRGQRLNDARSRLEAAVARRMVELRGRLSVLGAALHNVSPLGTLERGYAVVTDPQSGEIIDAVDKLEIGQTVATRLARGSFEALVKKKNEH